VSRTVLVTSRSFSTGTLDLVGRLREAGLSVVRGPAGHDLRQLAPDLGAAVAWIAGTGPVTAEHLALAPAMRVVARYGVGVDSVDVAAAAGAGVVVTNTPGANSEAVAELAFGLLFAAVRGVAAGDRRVRRGDWKVSRGRQVSGSVAGVIGFGRIGRGTATRVRALGCRVLVHDPHVAPAEIVAAGCEPVSAEQVSTGAELVFLHAPGGRVLVDERWLGRCRPGQVVVNTARADLVDEDAVAEALRRGRLLAYAADTLAAESVDGAASPLLAEDLADQVVVTPHLGAQTVEAVDRMGAMAVDDVTAVLQGRPPRHPVLPPGGPA
jgi:D-3-phosphoglycerate dehydrogenase